MRILYKINIYTKYRNVILSTFDPKKYVNVDFNKYHTLVRVLYIKIGIINGYTCKYDIIYIYHIKYSLIIFDIIRNIKIYAFRYIKIYVCIHK